MGGIWNIVGNLWLNRGDAPVAPQDYLQEQNSQLRQAIVEQTRAENLQVDWLFRESNWEVRQILLIAFPSLVRYSSNSE